MSRLNQQLKKGVFEILVLKIINQEDVYGYELIKTLENDSNGYFVLKEGSLYPIMYRLEDKGYIESYRKDAEGKRSVPRKYYRITEDGRYALEEMLGEWEEFSHIVQTMLSKED